MSDAYVIEAGEVVAGIAIRERGGFRFYASDNPFWDIDQRKFRRLQEIRAAVHLILTPSQQPGVPAVVLTAPAVPAPAFVDCIYA